MEFDTYRTYFDCTDINRVFSMVCSRRRTYFGHVTQLLSAEDHHRGLTGPLERPPPDFRHRRDRPANTWLLRTIEADLRTLNYTSCTCAAFWQMTLDKQNSCETVSMAIGNDQTSSNNKEAWKPLGSWVKLTITTMMLTMTAMINKFFHLIAQHQLKSGLNTSPRRWSQD